MIKRLFEIDPWKIATHQFTKDDRRLQESLTSIGNGYMGMRGNFEEQYTGDSHQGTYLAGIWYPDKTRVGWWKNGYPEYFGKVINATNFIGVDLYIDGKPLDLNKQNMKDFYLELDMRNGVLTRTFTTVSEKAEVKFSFQRFVSIVQQELALIKVEAEVIRGNADIQMVPKIDGNVVNEDSNYDEVFWTEQNRVSGEYSGLTVETVPNNFGVEQFTVTTVMTNQANHVKESLKTENSLLVEEELRFPLNQGEKATLVKYVAVVTSRDVTPAEQFKKAEELLAQAKKEGWASHFDRQAEAWGKRWHQADVMIVGDDEAQQGIRYNIFQLFSTYYGEDARLNVGPKGFTGEKYGGATYWDTEAYIVPMYLSVAGQDVTEKLLKYRHQQLPGAFHNAKQQGLKGALYPMVTFTGVECHNEWEITFEEIHRNGSIAYAIYNYTNYTGDESYLLNEGSEVLVAISRFWADRVHYSQRNKAYMIHGVTGPNEYENNINNNWYTNYIARWVLEYTLETIGKLDSDQFSKLAINDAEREQWEAIVEKMYLPEDQELGVFVQHDSFLDKDLQPADSLATSDRPLNQNWSWDKILRSCFIKQADVLQGIYYFSERFTKEEKQRNFDFYEPMTVHESSLSPCVHSILAAELGMADKAVELYSRTARLDLDNYNNDTEDGLHITSMSGSWLAIAQGFAGMKTYGSQLRFAPFCPENWQGYTFKITYRKRLIQISVDAESVRLELLEGQPIEIELYGQPVELVDTLKQSIS